MLQGQVKAHWLQRNVPRVKFIVCVYATLSFWNRSAAYIDIADTWPLTTWLSGVWRSKYAFHGSVAVAPYFAITQVVSNALVRVVVPQAWE